MVTIRAVIVGLLDDQRRDVREVGEQAVDAGVAELLECCFRAAMITRRPR
jgi:hypothetical protein